MAGHIINDGCIGGIGVWWGILWLGRYRIEDRCDGKNV